MAYQTNSSTWSRASLLPYSSKEFILPPIPADKMFEPKSAIHPSSAEDSEILVAGIVEGKPRNITVVDVALGKKFTDARVKRDEAVKLANDAYDSTFKALQTEAFSKASEKF